MILVGVKLEAGAAASVAICCGLSPVLNPGHNSRCQKKERHLPVYDRKAAKQIHELVQHKGFWEKDHLTQPSPSFRPTGFRVLSDFLIIFLMFN